VLVRELHRTHAVLLTLTLVVLALVGLAGTASANVDTDRYGTLKAQDRTTNGTTCVDEVIEFVPAADIVDWTLDVDVDNTTSAASFPSFSLDAAHLTHTMRLCPGQDPTGDYRLDGRLQGNLAPTPPGDGCCQFSNGYDAYFTFRSIDRKPTAITVKVARSNSVQCPLRRTKHCSRVSGRITRAGKPLKWDYVQIQAYKRGKWRRQAWGRSDGLGRVAWYVTITKNEKRLKFRLRYEASDYAKGSVSPTFRVKY
jgi:hypothetical protein